MPGSAASRSLDLSFLRESSPLPTTILPGKGDVIRYSRYLLDEAERAGRNRRNYPLSGLSLIIAQDILGVWQSLVSQFIFPITFEVKNIQGKVKDLLEKSRKLTSGSLRGKEGAIEKLYMESEDLFEIVSCRCPIFFCEEWDCIEGLCNKKAHIECNCEVGKKLPIFALKFVRCQRLRLHQQVDEVRRFSREQKESEEAAAALKFLHEAEERERERMKAQELQEAIDVEMEDVVDNVDDPDDDDYIPQEDLDAARNERNMCEMPLLGLMANRMTTSSREVALLVAAALIDLKFVTEADASKLVDKKKVDRAKEKMAKLQKEKRDVKVLRDGPIGIYLDGKKDKCLSTKELRGRTALDYENPVEDHYALVLMPEGEYFSHITVPAECPPGVKKGELIAELTLARVNDLKMNERKILCIGADSTALNTGPGGGIISWIERYLNRKVIWCVCLVHILELTPKNLFIRLDGGTASAEDYVGPIGKILKERVRTLMPNQDSSSWRLPQYTIPGLPLHVVKALSSDQKNLYVISQIITSGNLIQDFHLYTIGKLNKARFNTTWNRIFYLWICDRSQLSLSPMDEEVLRVMVHFLLGCYLPAWFDIRLNPHWLDAPRILVNFIRSLRLQDDDLVVRLSVQKTLQTGAFSLCEDTICQAMISGEDEDDRRFAIDKIVKNRERQGSPDIGNIAPEKRVNPKLNFLAEPMTLRTVISWDRVFREPPLTCEIPTKDLYVYVERRMAVPDFPSHTISVERAVKRVSKAGKHVTSEDRRDGVILSQIEACRLLPKFESKQDLMNLVQYANTYKKKKPSRNLSPGTPPSSP